MNTTKEVLQAARLLISKPENWTKGVYSMNEKGEYVHSDSAEACKWCALGAAFRASWQFGGGAPQVSPVAKLDMASMELGYDSAPHLNDTSDHDTVLKMFDLAIEMASNES